MIKRTLALAIAASLCAGTAMAENPDWFMSGSILYVDPDSRRNVDGDTSFSLGLGKYVTDRVSIEAEFDNYDFDFDDGSGEIDIVSYGLMARYDFLPDRKFNPFLGLGAGRIEHDGPFGDSNDTRVDVAGGFHSQFSPRVAMRGEIRYRFDSDSRSIPNDNDFDDWLFSLGVRIALGEVESPAPAPAPTPVAQQPAPPRDSDGDGVPDNRDRCPNTPAGVAVDANGCPLDQDMDRVPDFKDDCEDTPRGNLVDTDGCDKEVLVQLEGVHFAFDSAKLRATQVDELDEAVATLKKHENVQIEIAGHTDSVGSDSYNMKLSRERAETVRDYLVNRGISAARLTTRGYGESNPVVSNDTDVGRAKNRRVELRITSQ